MQKKQRFKIVSISLIVSCLCLYRVLQVRSVYIITYQKGTFLYLNIALMVY